MSTDAPKPQKYAHITSKRYKGISGTGEITVSGNFISGKLWFVRYTCTFADLIKIKLNKPKHGCFEVSIVRKKLLRETHPIVFNDKETALELYELLTERAVNAV